MQSALRLEATFRQERLLPVATCVDAFDADGMCICPELPWEDVSAFACADEKAIMLSRSDFLKRAEVPAHLEGRELVFLLCGGVIALHDLEEDVHYFFR